MTLKQLVERVSSRADSELAAEWPRMTPLEKAASFKLMPRERALKFFTRLPFAEQYFLIGAAPHGSVAPLLEDCGPAVDTLFHKLSKADVDAMTDHALKCSLSPTA